MRAIVMDRYGSPDVLHHEEIDRPVPGPGQMLIKVRASSVNPYDWHILYGVPKLFRPTFGGLRGPKNRVLGADFAGVVEEVGSEVGRFAPGDEVYGQTAAGAFADYVAVSESITAPKPASLSFEEAAAIPLAAVTALQGLRDHGEVRAGMSVLVNGASGGVGHFAVQIAKQLGAEVTGVCSTRNLDMVRELGADHVIDYTQENFTKGDNRYDLVFDLIGNHSVSASRRVVADGGMYLAGHGQPEHLWLGPILFMARMAVTNLFTKKRLKMFVASQSTDDLGVLAGMADEGTLRPVIDRTFPMEEVADAFRYLESWHARGKVVISA